MRVVIPAAGLGTRFLPATRVIPKEMLPVIRKPVIEYVVEEALAAGLHEILLVTGYAKRAVEDYFDLGPENGARIHFIRQKEQRGLGHAISLARTFTGTERFGVLLGDTIHEATTPALTQLLHATSRLGGCALAVEEVPEHKVHDYGIVEGRVIGPNLWQVTNLLEKPTAAETKSRLAITGAYLFTPDIYDALHMVASSRPKGEIQLTDAIGVLAREQAVYAVRFEGTRYDIGDPVGWLKANLEFARRDTGIREKLKGAVEPWARML